MVEIVGIAFDENGEEAVPPFIECPRWALILIPFILNGKDPLPSQTDLRSTQPPWFYDRETRNEIDQTKARRLCFRR